MTQIRCPHCLSPAALGQKKCPFCAKSLENKNPAGALPFAGLLAEKYTVGRFVEADGEGITYEGVCNDTGEKVMLREYLPVTLAQGRSQEGLLEPKPGQEVLFKTNRMDFADLYRTLKKITPSTGLVTVLDVLEQDDTVYAVTEVCRGQTLESWLSCRRGPLKPAEARSLIQPVLEGVAAIHKEGLVHRGVSPQNICVLPGGKAVLGGYATLGLRTRDSELKEKLYEGYSAPEQYAPEQFAGRYTDVYALAAVFYRMVTGAAPVPAPQRLVKESMPTARELDREIPGYLSAVLSRSMRLEPSERIQNVPELMGVLASQNAANALLERDEEEHTRTPDRRHKKADQSRYALLMTVLVLICAMLMFLCWIFISRDNDPAASEPPPPASSEPVSSRPEEIYVPSVVGMKYTDVDSNPDIEANFRFYVDERRYDSEHAAGIILEQHPAVGTPVPVGDNVISLVVSLGPEVVEMPYIIGFTRANAEEELNDRGIQFSLLTLENNGEYVSDCVAYTDVEPGTEIDINKVIVNVYIAGERGNMEILHEQKEE